MVQAAMRVAGALVVGLVLTGCATPRVITQISLSEGSARMIYAQAKTTATGIIECERLDNGTLTNCREIPITFVEK